MAGDPRPHILWIYCDELRTDALGCYGHASIRPRTPHVDRLAAEGVRLANCFCNSPLCVPSRVSVLTGRYVQQTGVYANEGAWQGFATPAPAETFPDVFARCGYRTASFGKIHVPPDMQPFQHVDTTGGRMPDLLAVVPSDHPDTLRPAGTKTALGGPWPADVPYPAEQVTDRGLAWLADAAAGDAPLLLRLSYLQPHTPVYPPPPFDELYDDQPISDSYPPRPGASAFEKRFAEIIDAGNFSPEQIRRTRRLYYGLAAWVDAQVGRVLAELDRLGLAERTVVVFDADHGASLGEGGAYAKHTFAPQVHRVPRILWAPGRIPAGRVLAEPTESLDLARTLMRLAGIDAPASFLGRDVLSDPPADAVFSLVGFGLPGSDAFPNLRTGRWTDGRGWPRRACIRTRRWRLDANVQIDGRPVAPTERDTFLADVQADPDELHNLADDPALVGVRAELEARLADHLADSVPVRPEMIPR